MQTNESAILLIFFNRPDLAKKCLDGIRATTRRVYISVDGPRDSSDIEAVNHVRFIAEEFSCNHNVKLLVRENNLGCKKAVSGAIDWAFEHENQLIILEDDINFGDEFLRTMDVWLDLHRDNKVIFHLNGYNPLPPDKELKSNYLCRYTHVWGWATWKDRWEHYDRDLSSWEPKNLGNLPGLVGQNLPSTFFEYWNNLLANCKNGFDTWDIQWLYSQWLYGGYSLTPGARLTGNLGFDDRATHTRTSGGKNRERQPESHGDLFLNSSDYKFDERTNRLHDEIEHGIKDEKSKYQTSSYKIARLFIKAYLSTVALIRVRL